MVFILFPSIFLSNFIYICLELLHSGIRADQLCARTEAKQPAEELIADLNLSCHAEMGIIHLGILDATFVIAETVNDSIQQRIDESDGHKFLIASKHGEHSFGVCFQVYLLKGFFALPGLAGKGNVLHPVHSVGSQIFRVISKGKQIIIAIID